MQVLAKSLAQMGAGAAAVPAPGQPHVASQLHPAQNSSSHQTLMLSCQLTYWSESFPLSLQGACHCLLPCSGIFGRFAEPPVAPRQRLNASGSLPLLAAACPGGPGTVPAELRSYIPPQHASDITVNAAWSRLEMICFCFLSAIHCHVSRAQLVWRGHCIRSR